MTRNEWKEIEQILSQPTVRLAMRGRCEEQGHQFQNCLTATFQFYEKCKWCEEIRL
jgi:hypothetical protein